MKATWMPYLLLIMLLTACSGPPVELPTQVSLVDAAAAAAETATANAPTATPTSRIPTLPPTFTPTDEPTATNTPLPTVPAPRPGRVGEVIMIANGGAIVSVDVAAGNTEVLHAQAGGLRALAASPDGSQLAYLAPVEAATEVFVISRAQPVPRQLSCLGLPNLRDPTWTPDGSALTIYAVPAPEQPGGIYRIGLDNACPVADEQALLVDVQSEDWRGMAWNQAGDLLFYAVGERPIYAYSLSDQVSVPVTLPSGFGPDFAPRHNPDGDQLAYLGTMRDPVSRALGGALHFIDDTTAMPEPIGRMGTPYNAEDLRWSGDGSALVLLTPDNLALIDLRTLSTEFLFNTPRLILDVIFSPDSAALAYAALDERAIAQVYHIDLVSGRQTQLTNNSVGTINSLVWVMKS